MQVVRLSLVTAALLLVLPTGLLAQGGRGGGQAPRNLQVLPKDMPRPELTALMRSITNALGVRCSHCHVVTGTNANGQEEHDYALDDKETKKVAREMLKMVADINEKYLPATGRNLDPSFRVTCETCHHGLARPQTLRAALAAAVQGGGPDSAVALYKALRERYFGSGAYDFRENALVEAAAELARAERRPAAIALLKLNLEYYPNSAPTYAQLGQQQLAAGDTAAAVAALQKALELQPNNPQVQGLLQRLRRP